MMNREQLDLYQANAFAGCAPIHNRLFLMSSHAGALEISWGNVSHNREFLQDVSTPIRRIRFVCARAASGQATAVPPRSVMNSRRLMSNMRLPCRHRLIIPTSQLAPSRLVSRARRDCR